MNHSVAVWTVLAALAARDMHRQHRMQILEYKFILLERYVRTYSKYNH
jgi:hypothetical protein